MSIDLRNRKAMVDFLTGHFRYNTMNGWNQATSYAAKVKIYDFVPRELQDRAFEIIGVDDSYDPINDIINEWGEEQGYSYQAGFNGRSSGYIVMYTGGSKPSEYKRICLVCGQKNYKSETTKCGRCGAEAMQDYKGIETFTYSGRGLDMGETFEDWTMDALRERVKIVQSFDAMVERCKAEFLSLCKTFKVVEKEIQVTKKIKVLEEA
jgi:ribosomal protein L37E